MAGGRPDEFLLIGSMDVDVAITGVAILRIDPIKPENTTQDQIFITSRGGNHSGGLTALEAHPCLGLSSELCVDSKVPGRSLKASFMSPKPVLGGGDVVGNGSSIFLEQIEPLCGDIQYETFAGRGWRGGVHPIYERC